jgi:hypothetical protein
MESFMNSLNKALVTVSNIVNQNAFITLPAGLSTATQLASNIAMGILELANLNTLHKSFDSRFSNKIFILKTTCDSDILKAQETLLSCPEAQKLWNEVETAGAFTIRCATGEEAPAGALVWVESREILLSESNKEMVKPLLFELNNLKRAEAASLIGKYKCNLGSDEYATATEAVEYGTVQDTYRISDSCVKGGFWSNDLSQYQEEFTGQSPDVDWTSFKGYLETQEKYGHTDLYRLEWFKKCDPAALPRWIASNMDKWRAVLDQSQDKDEL